MKRGSLQLRYSNQQYCDNLPLLARHINANKIIIYYYNHNLLHTEVRYIEWFNTVRGSVLPSPWYKLSHYSLYGGEYRGTVTLSGESVIDQLKDGSYVIVHV